MDEGVNTDQIITGKKLEDEEDLIRLGSEISSPKPIKETQQSLANKVFQLEEGGQTALGPALVVAFGLASRCAGSKIIVCTDGVANVGLGRLDGGTDEEREKFYNDMGDKAAEKGVSISVIAIKGADSKLLYLGKLADRTNGQVNHVDPLKLTEEFGNILADRIIATNVTATMILQKSMKFSDKDTDGNVFVENIGNATMDTEITFHYEKRGEKHTNNTASGRTASTSTESDAKKEGDTVPVQEEVDPGSSNSKCTPNPSALEPCELPFQLQLEYTDTYGTKALRVLTEKQPVTKNRKKAEESVDVEVIGVHTARTVADYGLKGEYTKAREVALMNQRLAWRHTRASAPAERKKAYKKMFNNIQVADRHVTHAQLSERTRYGKSHSDSEEDDEVDFSESKGPKRESCAVPASDGPSASAPPKSKARKKKAKRSEEVTDDMANDFYCYKNANFSKLLQ